MIPIHLIIPTLRWSGELKRTLQTIEYLPHGLRGKVVLVAPAEEIDDINTRLQGSVLPECAILVMQETETGVYPAFNDGLRALRGERGYVLFLGAGDELSGPAREVLEAMDQDTPLICIPTGGDPAFETLRRFPESERGWLTCLPNSQGCIYNLALREALYFDENLRIYDDVLQRIRIIKKYPHRRIVCAPVVTIHGHGVSGVQSAGKLLRHILERGKLLWPILCNGEPLLAAKYAAGMGRMFVRYLARNPAYTTKQ